MPWNWKSPWYFLFGRSISPEEMLRKNQRALNKTIRDLDRERARMEAQEKKLIVDIKKMAKDNQNDAVMIMAKDIVRTRKYIKKFMLMKANVQGVAMRISTLRSQNAMTSAMTGVTMAMRRMNAQLRLPAIENILREFEKQSTLMDMKGEMIEEAIDDAMGEVDDEEEGDTIVAQIFDELGLQLSDQLRGLPETQSAIRDKPADNLMALPQTSAPLLPSSNNIDDDIQARLDQLRRR